MGVIVGCCGFSVSRDKYFRTFQTVELQKTFYQPPSLATIKKLKQEAPEDFIFHIKAWQLITHRPSSPTYRKLKEKVSPLKEKHYGFFKPTDEVFEAWNRTREIASILDAGVIVFQCPQSFTPTDENIKNMRRFFSSLDRAGFVLGWEPRGIWDEGKVAEICIELNLLHIVDPFKASPQYGDILYFRLHGISGYRYMYTHYDLSKLKEMVLEKNRAYVMFNNTYMFDNGLEFKKIIEQKNNGEYTG